MTTDDKPDEIQELMDMSDEEILQDALDYYGSQEAVDEAVDRIRRPIQRMLRVWEAGVKHGMEKAKPPKSWGKNDG